MAPPRGWHPTEVMREKIRAAARRPRGGRPIRPDVLERAVALYETLPMSQVERLVGVTRTRLQREFRKRGIEPRGRQAALKLAHGVTVSRRERRKPRTYSLREWREAIREDREREAARLELRIRELRRARGVGVVAHVPGEARRRFERDTDAAHHWDTWMSAA